VFWLDLKYLPARMSVTVTSMLTLIAYRFLHGGDLPQLAYLTRMDHFLIGATLLVLLTVVQVAFTTALKEPLRLSSPRMSIFLILYLIAKRFYHVS